MAKATQQDRLTVAIMAMGGQGGGVLCDWLTTVAEASGYVAQSTSVPGVAQRTGATIYYVEMMKAINGKKPVLALMPVPGDVDVVIASELMEAGRAIQRGLVTPDKTVLIASGHRTYAVSEKEKPGEGAGDGSKVLEAADVAAKRFILADFEEIARVNGSMISAALLGALVGSGALPFSREAFEAAITEGGVGVKASLRTLDAAMKVVQGPPKELQLKPLKDLPPPPQTVGIAALDAVLKRLHAEFPAESGPMLYAGLRHLVDYQDVAYAVDYLDRMAAILAFDKAAGGTAKNHALTTEMARQLARAMAYDDIIRVADLKTRSARGKRVASEVGVDADKQVLQTTEFFHPRMEEICSVLPRGLGAAIENRKGLYHWLDRRVDKGRRLRTDTVLGFMQLYLIASRRRARRGTLRHGREMDHIAQWVEVVRTSSAQNYDLAVELAKCRRLIKGYSDTMSRGLSKYDRVLAGAARIAHHSDAADWVRRLRMAALVDEHGQKLDEALKTIDSFIETPAVTH